MLHICDGISLNIFSKFWLDKSHMNLIIDVISGNYSYTHCNGTRENHL